MVSSKFKIKKGSWLVKVVAFLIAFTFIAFGATAFLGFSVNEGNEIASVNGEAIFDVQLARQQRVIENQLINTFGADAAQSILKSDPSLAERQALQALVTDKVWMQKAKQFDFHPSIEAVNNALVNLPNFQVNGRFDEQLLQQALQQSEMTLADLQDNLIQDIALRNIRFAVTASAFSVPKILDVQTIFENQQRSLRYRWLPLENFAGLVSFTDKDLQDFYETHQSNYLKPALVQFDFISLKLNDYANSITVSEAQLNEAYQGYKLQQVEQKPVSLAHILVDFDGDETKALSKIKQLKQKLTDGSDFAELAKNESDDFATAAKGGEMGSLLIKDLPQSIADVAIQLAQGVVSEPVKTQFGYHLIKVIKKPDLQGFPTFAEKRDDLTSQIQIDQARGNFAPWRQKVADAAFASDDLQIVAEEFNLTVENNPLSDEFDLEQSGWNSVIVEASFSETLAEQGLISDLLEQEKNSEYVLLQVREFKPVEQLSFLAVKNSVIEDFKQQTITEQLTELTQQWQDEFNQLEDKAQAFNSINTVIGSLTQGARNNDWHRITQAKYQDALDSEQAEQSGLAIDIAFKLNSNRLPQMNSLLSDLGLLIVILDDVNKVSYADLNSTQQQNLYLKAQVDTAQVDVRLSEQTWLETAEITSRITGDSESAPDTLALQ